MPEALTLWVPDDVDPRVERAIHRFAESLHANVRVGTGDDRGTTGGITLRLLDRDASSEAYQLRIESSCATLTGAGPAGLFYGLQTLLQISRPEPNRWQCRVIDDAPDLAIRGLSLDVARGRMPTMDTLERLVDRLAALKINHLQLYVEHTFDFRFDPDIARGCSPLTHDDIRRLDAYCRDRFIDLVPSIATFGHMGRILSLPRYRHLAEVEATQPWEAQSWPQRLRGLTIDARNPNSRDLLRSMLDDYLPLFSSGLANVNADETHDLGRGRNREFCERFGRGRLYVDHLKFLADVCRGHGKRMMFWGDVIRNHAELLPEVPADAVMLDWGYDAQADFSGVCAAERGSRDVCVCPGTSGWNRLINAMGTADANISNAVAAAKTYQAAGMIITDWGDHGHFNLLACSLPAIARAAAGAWNAGPADPGALDHAIEVFLFGAHSAGTMEALRRVAQMGDDLETWPRLYEPLSDSAALAEIDRSRAQLLKSDALAALTLLRADGDDIDVAEWRLACQASVLLADKILLAHSLATGADTDAVVLCRFADDVDLLVDRYVPLWLARYRAHRLEDITSVLAKLAQEAQKRFGRTPRSPAPAAGATGPLRKRNRQSGPRRIP